MAVVPEQFGRYVLERLMAKGGMAEIFSARPVDEPGAPRLCIKRIRPEFSDDPEFESMFRQEARIALAIDHPFVVRVFEFDRHDGQLFIAMEFVDGMDLKALLQCTREAGIQVPLGFAFHATRCLLMALHAAALVRVNGELRPVVHRDISPHNLLVARSGEVKLADFGIAKARGSSTVTRTGVIKGKLAYLSPEQACGKEVGAASDLYGVGLVLYEMLTGQRFNTGGSETEILAGVLNPVFKPIGWLSGDINAFLSRLLARNPDDRFADAQSAMDALDGLGLPTFGAAEAALFMRLLMPVVDASSPHLMSLRTSTPVEPAMFGVPSDTPGATGEQTLPVPPETAVPDRRRRIVTGSVVALGLVVLAVAVAGAVFTPGRSSAELEVTGAPISADASAPTSALSGVKNKEAEPDSGNLFGEKVNGDLVVHLAAPVDTGVDRTRVDDGVSSPAPTPAIRKKESRERRVVEKKTPEPPPPAVVEYGELQVNCRPWAWVSIDGENVGTSPIRSRRLTAGMHRVDLVNDKLDYKKTIDVQILPSQMTKVSERIEE